jgi:cellulose synthase/poly-beta-1,6-N-acetylglucosamine synthase-like glycosyltransferase
MREILRDQSYPSDLYQIAVIADNCTDDTAVIARKAGAHHVLTRHAPDARGKGQALRWAPDQVLTWSPVVEAIVVVDALAERDLIKSLVRKFEAGADVVQGLSIRRVRPGRSSRQDSSAQCSCSSTAAVAERFSYGDGCRDW